MSESAFQKIKAHALLLLGLLAVMWLAETLDRLLPADLDHHGIVPRTLRGLVGIPLAPFLHAGFGHLAANSIPFLVLGGLLMLGGGRVFLGVSLWVTIAGGLGVWLLGPAGTVHLGASLLVFGYLGFLLGRGLFERRAFWVLVSIALLVAYGGALRGILPGQPGISWLGHLCGLLAGAVGAWLMFPKGERLFGAAD
jgi:membrane associated rhomboid family serine protease